MSIWGWICGSTKSTAGPVVIFLLSESHTWYMSVLILRKYLASTALLSNLFLNFVVLIIFSFCPIVIGFQGSLLMLLDIASWWMHRGCLVAYCSSILPSSCPCLRHQALRMTKCSLAYAEPQPSPCVRLPLFSWIVFQQTSFTGSSLALRGLQLCCCYPNIFWVPSSSAPVLRQCGVTWAESKLAFMSHKRCSFASNLMIALLALLLDFIICTSVQPEQASVII